jgi:DNA-directed RNA polymerase specialized sigma24 family protein
METPPTPFEALANLAEDTDPTQRAKTIGAALNAVPDLQKWLRTARQNAVTEMHETGLSYADIGQELGMDRVRAHQIAKGATTGRKPKPKPADPAS